MWRKCRQIYPNNIWEESADKDRARRMKDRGYFTDLYHCNEPNWTRWQALEDDVVMCMFAAGTERGREGREGWFLPLAFHYFLFPINASISGVSKQHRANRNESGASRHALAAISVVHLVVHTSCHHGQRESFAASVFLKQRVFVIYLARLHGGWSRLGDFILCFTLDGWAMFGGKWGKRNNCEK